MGDAKSGCIVDISFDCDSGPATTTVILNLLSAYPLARPLILVAKYYLKQKYLVLFKIYMPLVLLGVVPSSGGLQKASVLT
jgi:DNA polymerase sigma